MAPYCHKFSRHLGLAIGAFLGVKPDFSSSSKSFYIHELLLGHTYRVASRDASRQACRHKQRYDVHIREAKVEISDKVLVRKIGLKGQHNFADRWDRDVQVIIEQSNLYVPVSPLRKEFARGPVRTMHRNFL